MMNDRLRAFCVLCADPENQPHQFVGNPDGLLAYLRSIIRGILEDWVGTCNPDGDGECVMFEALGVASEEPDDGETWLEVGDD